MKILIEMWMDGYDTEEEMKKACLEYVKDQLDSAGTSVQILWAEKS